MARAAAILLQHNCVALIERNRNGEIYYLFPGGQIEEGETQVDTTIREVKEELGLVVRTMRLLAEVTFRGKKQFYYYAEIESGVFGTGDGAEMLGMIPSEYGTYAPVWVPINDLKSRDVRPRVVANLVEKYPTQGWPINALIVKDSN